MNNIIKEGKFILTTDIAIVLPPKSDVGNLISHFIQERQQNFELAETTYYATTVLKIVLNDIAQQPIVH